MIKSPQTEKRNVHLDCHFRIAFGLVVEAGEEIRRGGGGGEWEEKEGESLRHNGEKVVTACFKFHNSLPPPKKKTRSPSLCGKLKTQGIFHNTPNVTLTFTFKKESWSFHLS